MLSEKSLEHQRVYIIDPIHINYQKGKTIYGEKKIEFLPGMECLEIDYKGCGLNFLSLT